MGLFFENYHIKMSGGDNQKELKEAIESAFAKQGYVSCEDESATKSLVLSTSETGNWTSMIFSEENEGEVDREFCSNVFLKLVEQMDAYGLIVNCVDSDFASIDLVSKKDNIYSTITIGDSYTSEVTEKEELDNWKGVVDDIEKLYEVCCDDYTFAEEGLEMAAHILGIETNGLYLSEDDKYDENLTTYYFKKKNQRRKSFKTLFLEIFEEGLKEEGFVRVKGKYPYLARMVSEEVYQVITYKDEWCAETYQPQTRGCKAFTIMGTFRSIYSELFDFDDSPRNNAVLMRKLWYFQFFAERINSLVSEYDYFLYYPNDEKSVKNAIKKALNATKEEIIKPYVHVKNLKECLMFNESLFFQNQCAPKYDEEKKEIVETSNEGVSYTILEKCNDFIEYLDDYIVRFKVLSKLESKSKSYIKNEENKIRTNMLYNMNSKEELKQYEEPYLRFMQDVKIREEENREALKRMNIMY